MSDKSGRERTNTDNELKEKVKEALVGEGYLAYIVIRNNEGLQHHLLRGSFPAEDMLKSARKMHSMCLKNLEGRI